MDKQLNFLAIGWKKKMLKSERFLKEMNAVVPWKQLVALVESHYADGRMGRKSFPLELMLRIYCLQQWFNLSDPAAEEAIYDRNSFQRFLSLDIVGDNVPDETTIFELPARVGDASAYRGDLCLNRSASGSEWVDDEDRHDRGRHPDCRPQQHQERGRQTRPADEQHSQRQPMAFRDESQRGSGRGQRVGAPCRDDDRLGA